MPRFRDLPEFGPTMDAAAARLRVSATVIEKDYWVSEALRALADGHQENFVFKGGTSLSKGFAAIERFSEDIDILVRPGERGKGAIDRLMKSMGATAALALGIELPASTNASRGVHRTYRLSYPATRPPIRNISTYVELEMGIRGDPDPHLPVAMRSLFGDALAQAGADDYDDLRQFEVETLHPGRTLLEKLYVAHQIALRLEADPSSEVGLAREVRHFYDIHQLLGMPEATDLLQDRTVASQIRSSIEHTCRNDFGITGELRPEVGFAASPAFDPENAVFRQLARAYPPGLVELHYGQELPPWDHVCARVRDCAL